MTLAIKIIKYLMRHRAHTHIKIFNNQLKISKNILDVGSGTGDFGSLLREVLPIKVTETDVCDFSMHGNKPVIFDGIKLPFDDDSFDCVSMMGILHYLDNPDIILAEAQRVGRTKILILQTASKEVMISKFVHQMQEALEGRYAWSLAKSVGCFSATSCPLQPAKYITYEELCNILNKRFSNWRIVAKRRSYFMGVLNYFIEVVL